ncbi:hypothetical protein [Curvibacter lanceolatus]|uniref:hypothetical protein n=1 Tax=Curvibacter lanceolatus TaxID=86182 RepID=UPI0012FCAECB|nr:hypothetical protein [Curvibacter lanceolatus]
MVEKDGINFSRCSANKDGLQYQCKECKSAYKKENREATNLIAKRGREKNPEKHRAATKKWFDANKQRALQKRKIYYYENLDYSRRYSIEYKAKNPDYYVSYRNKNIERETARVKRWAQANKHRLNASYARRRFAKSRSTPLWANKEAIIDIYKKSRELSQATGVEHHVDHIVPLQSDVVCGLHCEANLQIIDAKENIRKNNRWWPDMP